MKRNVIKLKKGSVTIEKEPVDEKKQSEKERELMNKLLSESLGLGISIALPIAGGAILGVTLDRLLTTAPKLTLGFLFFGVFISMLKMIQLARTGETK